MITAQRDTKFTNYLYDTLFDKYDFIVKWRVTYACNYHCSYCYQNERCNKNFERPFDLIETAKKIDDLIKRVGAKKPMIMMIGGEASLLPLNEIKWTTNPDIHITTNFSAPIEYYNSIPDLELCTSYHHEYNTPEAFYNKFKQLNVKNKFVEMVYNDDTKEDVNALIKLLDKDGFKYIVDYDRLQIDKAVPVVSLMKEPRVIFKGVPYDNKQDIFGTNKYLPTTGYRCNMGLTYCYIKGDVAFQTTDTDCKNKVNIEDWKPHSRICQCTGCTICGAINLWEDESSSK